MIFFLRFKRSMLLVITAVLLTACMTKTVNTNTTASIQAISPKKFDKKAFIILKQLHNINLTRMLTASYQQENKGVMSSPSVLTVLKNLILQYEKASRTAHAPSAQQLAKCQFVGQRIEVDDRAGSAEWLVTTAGGGHCQSRSENIPKTFWIVQQKAGEKKSSVLTSDRAYTVRIWNMFSGKQWREIDATSTNMIGKTEILCHRIQANNGSGYALNKKEVEAYMSDAMMPGKSWLPTTNPRYRCLP